jgi:hypothetical protein
MSYSGSVLSLYRLKVILQLFSSTEKSLTHAFIGSVFLLFTVLSLEVFKHAYFPCVIPPIFVVQ